MISACSFSLKARVLTVLLVIQSGVFLPAQEKTTYPGYAPEGYGRKLVMIGQKETLDEFARIMAVRHGFHTAIFENPASAEPALITADLLVMGHSADAENTILHRYFLSGRPGVALGKTGFESIDKFEGEKIDYRLPDSNARKGRMFRSVLAPQNYAALANGIFWCLEMAIPAKPDVTPVTADELAAFQKPRPPREDVDPGFDFANHPVNQHRTYHWYRDTAAKYLRSPDHLPDILDTYPDIDGGVQGHWGVFHKNSYRDRRYNLAEHGPAVGGIFRSGKQTQPRTIAVRLNDQFACAFDTETLRYSHVWKGGFLKFPANRWGIGGGISPDGEVTEENVKRGGPSKNQKFLGYHVAGNSIIFAYEIDGEKFYDTPVISSEGKFEPEKVAAESSGIPLSGPPSFSQAPISLTGKPGTRIPNTPFTMDRIPVPLHNELGSVMLLGGLDFFSNGDAAVCTMMGDVWRVSGLDAELKNVTWTRIATGLNQALGLSIFDDKIYVVGRDRITRLHDLNDDGEIDFYENFCDDYPASPGGHDFYVGLQRDDAGYFYFVAANTGVIKVAPDGSSTEVLADGLRNANGIGVRGDGLVVTSTNEGDWTPASAVMEVQSGDFYGRKAKKDGKPIAPAMAYIPRGIDNSSGGQIFCTSKKWGPFHEKLFHFSFGNGTWMMILRDEQTGERTQGMVVPLPGDFESGAHRARFNPADGQLYVVGADGWGNYAITDGSFARIRYQEKSENHFPVAWKVRKNGIEIQFATALDPASVTPGNVFAQRWNYTYGEHYGSLEFSLKNPEMPGHDPVSVTATRLSEDGKTLLLEIPDLVPAMQYHLYGELKTASGVDFKLNTFPTILRVPEDESGKISKRLELPIRWPVAFTPKVPQGKPGRKLRIEAISGLRFSEKELRAKPGEQISIQVQNMDSIPHNFVICKPGTFETVGMASNKMLANPKIAEMHYVPESDDVMHYTPMLYTRNTYTLHITAPEKPGNYPYMCTFPGHWAVMKGSLVVE